MADAKGLHEELHDVRNDIYCEAENITNLDDGKFFYNAADLEVIRGHAKRILVLVDQYEKLDTGERKT